MIRAEDLKNGNVKPAKPHTSVLPYLRAEQAKKDSQTEKEAKEEAVRSAVEDTTVTDREKMKTTLKYIHPSATEAELEEMVKDAIG